MLNVCLPVEHLLTNKRMETVTEPSTAGSVEPTMETKSAVLETVDILNNGKVIKDILKKGNGEQ